MADENPYSKYVTGATPAASPSAKPAQSNTEANPYAKYVSPGYGFDAKGNQTLNGRPVRPEDVDPIYRAVSGALSKTPAPGIYNALVNRPIEAAHAKMAGTGGYWDTLLHGDQNPERSAALAYQRAGINPGDTLAPLAQASLDTLVSPLSALNLGTGGRSIAARMADAATAHSLPLAVKAGQAINKVPVVGPKVTGAVAKLHDIPTVHGAAKRAAAEEYGAQWPAMYGRARAGVFSQSPTTARVRQPIEAIDPRLAPEVAPPLVSAKPPTAPTEAARKKTLIPPEVPVKPGTPAKAATVAPVSKSAPPLPKRPPAAPSRTEFDRPEATLQERKRTLIPPPVVPKSAGVISTPVAEQAAEAARQKLLHVSQPTGAEGGGMKIGERAPSAEREDTTAERIAKKRDKLTEQTLTPADQRIRDLIAEADKPYAKHPLNRIQDLADWQTSIMFGVPFRHEGNIGIKGLLADPTSTLKTIGMGVAHEAKKAARGKLGAPESEEARAARLAGFRHAGGDTTPAVGSTERGGIMTTGLGDVLEKTKGMSNPLIRAGRQLARPIHALYSWSSNSLWPFDEEVKNQRWSTLVKGGMDPYEAATRVGKELVDYEHKTPLAKAAKPIAPFSIWRTSAPGSTLRNVLENPARATFGASAFPAAFGGSSQVEPDRNELTTSLPTAELGKITSGIPGAASYGMGTLGTPIKLAGDVAGAAATAKSKNERLKKMARTLFTSGIEPGTYAAQSIAPLALYLQLQGQGMFQRGQQPSTLESILNQFSGAYPVNH